MNYQIFFEDKNIDSLEFFKILDKFREISVENRVAVFDFDNTLIQGDIGEAIFAEMLKNKKNLNLSWKEYNELIASGNTKEAYKRLISSYENFHKDIILTYTQEVFKSDSSDIEYITFTEEGKFYNVPMPIINNLMLDIILKLQILDFKIFIISASSDISVKYLGNKIFNIPEENIFGMKNKEDSDGFLKYEIESPVPCFEGKKELYKKLIGSRTPLITAGDSENDLAFMNLTSEDGIKLIVKKIEDDEEAFQEKLSIYTDSFDHKEHIYAIKANI